MLYLPIKGLKRPLGKFDGYIDVHKFMRKISIKKYFLNKNPVLASSTMAIAVDSRLKNKSLFNPPSIATQHLEVFKKCSFMWLDLLTPIKDVNLRCIKEGIEALESRKDIVIRPADKGG